MSYEYEWTDDDDVRIYWEGELIGTAENTGRGRSIDPNGSPTGADEFVANWLSDKDIPNELGYSQAIMMCISLEAGDFTER